MADFVQGWAFTALWLVVITIVFVAALIHLRGELGWVHTLTDHLGWELVAGDADAAPASRPAGGLDAHAVRDDVHAVLESSDPWFQQKQVRSWLMRAHRLEPALAFWVDLLRQLGLLGTVVGLGMSLAVSAGDVGALLGPLGLAVWTTVAGLGLSVVLSSAFAMKLTAWVDACEKNVEAW
ncbi:MAG: MotA/TolQ/ExbB proton channel family protein, partial [Myxococcales bacterium]|nr:MotA/TolQ/ExbB proton channel family protein [Myxococcales bacterium]